MIKAIRDKIFKELSDIIEDKDLVCKNTKQYSSVYYMNLQLVRLYVFKAKSPRLEIKNLLDKWEKHTIESVDEIEKYYNQIREVVFDYINRPPTIGCCHLYVECSNAKKCLNTKYEKNCLYNENLKNNKIFYGVNKNYPKEDRDYNLIKTLERITKSDKYPKDYTVIDIETTGFSAERNEIIEIAALKVRDDIVIDTFSELIKPDASIPDVIQNKTGITNEDVRFSPSIDMVLPDFLDFVEDDIVVGHNVTFDKSFISVACERQFGFCFENEHFDTLTMARQVISDSEDHKLTTLAQHLGIPQKQAHRALEDCYTTYLLYMKLCELKETIYQDFVDKFPKSELLLGKKVVFKGKTTLCDFETYTKICEKAGGEATEIFYSTVDYIVFGNNRYPYFVRGQYSEDMEKAVKLRDSRGLVILSETMFAEMLGVEIAVRPKKKKSFRTKIDIKSMIANTNDFDDAHPLFGKVCVFTGALQTMDRKEAMQEVIDVGGFLGNSVTKKTNYLILGNNDMCATIKDGKSTKQKKAEEYIQQGFDIKIINEYQFYKLLKNEE